jgi:hypothetical protein
MGHADVTQATTGEMTTDGVMSPRRHSLAATLETSLGVQSVSTRSIMPW